MIRKIVHKIATFLGILLVLLGFLTVIAMLGGLVIAMLGGLADPSLSVEYWRNYLVGLIFSAVTLGSGIVLLWRVRLLER